MKHSTLRYAALVLILAGAAALPRAQQVPAPGKKALTVDDYSKWRSISGQEISGDGQWVTYGLSLTNTAPTETKPVLHLVRLDNSQDVEVPNATGGTFSSDSKWIAYVVDPSGGRGGRGGRGNGGGGNPPADTPPPADPSVPPGAPAPPATPTQTPPTTPPATVPGETPPATTAPAPGTPGQAPGARGGNAARPEQPTRVELRNLSTGAVKSWQDIQSFTFSANATHLILRRRPAHGGRRAAARRGAAAAPAAHQAAARRRGGAGAAPAGPRGVDVILHNLTTGRDQLLGSVGDIAFNKSGELLAYTVDAAVKDGNGLFVLDLRNGRINTLDNDAQASTTG